MSLEKAEAEKYEKVWGFDEYRRSPSPGGILCKRLPVYGWLKEYGIKSVLDAGCGQGQLVRHLRGAFPDINTWGMDIANNAPHDKIRDVFINGCLWDAKNYPQRFDAIFSIDVAEHIPTERVMDYLTAMRDHANKFVFLTVDLNPDKLGKRLMGYPLHLTIKSCYWWLNRFETLGFGVRFALIDSKVAMDVLLEK